MALFKEILPLRVIPHWSVGEIRPCGKNASENHIRRTFNGVTFRSIMGSRYCSGILLAGLQAKVAAIIFSPASLPDFINFARDSEILPLRFLHHIFSKIG